MQGISTSTCILAPVGKAPMSLSEGLPRIAEAGFPLIELSRRGGAFGSHAALIHSCGLRVWAVHGTLGGGATALDETERRSAVAREIPRLESAAQFAPCPYVIHYLDRFHDRRRGAAFRKSVEELLVRAEELQIRLAVETAPDKVENERYPPSREIADFVRSLNSPWASVCVDVNHSNLGEDLAEAIANCTGIISSIHVSDNHGIREDHLPPGEGAIDFPAAMTALNDAGYTGPVNLECHLAGYPTVAELTELRRRAEQMGEYGKAGQHCRQPAVPRPEPRADSQDKS